ncbi:MAG: carboxypeptidase-like regulatory domain-containing protein [Bryobacterales bacterium]|nr:carboxypeptidase-like regulatory domain-containing protein [Bryobacteraceae bacterium]MDW8353363.1 carboxypeptidase-like regulatory domain-containing protein [Bryobacterales bacterium]
MLAGSAAAPAQVLTGTLTGIVVDPTDAVIPGASVTVTDLATGREYKTVTAGDGTFTLTNLPNGFYRVLVEAKGFNKLEVERVQIFVAQTARVHARMEVATTGVEVVVRAEQPVVQTETVELKYGVDRSQILNLPLPTRNPLDLVRTLPGVVTPTSSGIADSFVHGLRGNSTNITQDGINVADNFVKTSSFFAISAPTVDTVGEFNVSIGGIGVDSGFGAAQVAIRTHRGSNEFHGSLFWFQRNHVLNANTWFNNASRTPRPFQLQNRIGASAGGPVYIPKLYDGRNRTFIFGMYEAFREPLSRSRVRTVLTPDARRGLFTYTPTSGGAPVQVNLLTLGTIGTSSIPPAINSDVMNFYNALVPVDNLTDTGCAGDGLNIRCYSFNIPGKNKVDRYTLRVDHQVGNNHSIEFVFNQADFDSTPDLLNGIEPMFPKSRGGNQASRRQVFAWAFHSAFGANKTNEARFGFQRAPVGFNLFEDYSQTGGYQLTVGTVTDPTLTQGNLPQGRNTPVRQVTNNFAWVKGRHSLRLGGEYRQVVANSYFYNVVVPRVFLGTNPANPNGITASQFPGGISAGDLSRASGIFNLVTGLLGSIQQGFNHTSPTSGFVPGVPRRIDPIQHHFAWYIQDNLKIRRGLNLQLGVRWEYQGVFDLRNGLILLPKDRVAGLWGPAGVGNLFNPRTNPAATDTLLDFAGGRNGRPVYQRDLNNFAPFIGLAWDPRGDGKTSIRAGFSSHYTQDGLTLFQVSATGNTGLFSVLANTTPTGVFSTRGNPAPARPTASFPVSQRANFIANTGANLWEFDPRLRTPYVLGWHLSVQRELWNRITIEGRYIGNHAVKLFRSWSLNELDFANNGLLQEFRNAQRNLAIGRTSFANQGLPGQVPLPIFERLFAGLSAASGFANSTFITQLNQNQIGALFDTIRRSNTYRVNREANFPLNFFVANPFANLALMVDNSSWSYYHGLEIEVNRRFSSGLFFQSNYTFGKVLTDTRFLTSQQEFQNYFSLSNRRLDKHRAAFDVTHSFSANFMYPLPIGRGQALAGSAPMVVDKLISGWSINAFTRWSSGAPFTITSGRQTTGSLETTTAVLRNMPLSEFRKHVGVYRTGSGVFWLNPNSGLVTISGTASRAVFCTAGQTTPCFDHPGVNEDGNLPWFGLNAPRFFNQDFGIIKRTPIRSVGESFNFEIRLEMFNAFNNPNFTSLQTGIDSASFGKMTSTVDTVRGGGVTARIIQWAVRVNW